MPNMPILRQFNLQEPAVLLLGGSTRVYRVGQVVVKRIRETSLENNHSPALAAWIAGFSAGLPQCIAAIFALHQALKSLARHPLMEDNHTAWGFAHRACWADKPGGIQPEMSRLVNELVIDYTHANHGSSEDIHV